MTREEFLRQLPSLVANYQPSPAVLGQIKNVSLLMVIGPSGAGKTTMINNLDIPSVPIDTSRDLRPGEVDGKDLYIVKNYDKAVDDLKTGQFVQVLVGVNGDLYGTKATSYPASGVAVMPVLADVVPNFRSIGFRTTVSIFITPPSYAEWMKRLSSHAMDGIALDLRLTEAYRSFAFALGDVQTHFILNDEIEKAVLQINELVNSRVQSVRELTARAAAEEIFSHLK